MGTVIKTKLQELSDYLSKGRKTNGFSSISYWEYGKELKNIKEPYIYIECSLFRNDGINMTENSFCYFLLTLINTLKLSNEYNDEARHIESMCLGILGLCRKLVINPIDPESVISNTECLTSDEIDELLGGKDEM